MMLWIFTFLKVILVRHLILSYRIKSLPLAVNIHATYAPEKFQMVKYTAVQHGNLTANLCLIDAAMSVVWRWLKASIVNMKTKTR
ncbi:hypothetical protein DP903_03970 [Escherichia coli O73]|nr:hypothetical protein [Escherichia coli O73]